VHRQLTEQFYAHVQSVGKAEDVAPVFATSRHVLLHVRRGDLFILGAVGRDVAPLLVIELLSRIADLLELYLKELTENALRHNFITVYQLLDEMIDNGAPLHTESNVLQELVLPPAEMKSMVAAVTGSSQVSSALPEGTMSDAPWRRAGVRYAANELYVDLMERVDAVVDASTGMLRSAEVWGEALCKCQLSGRPELTLTFVNPHILEDVSFHQCVRLPRWERENCLSFVPPDGKFSLFAYRVRGIGGLPIYVSPNITFAPPSDDGSCSEGRLSVMVGIKHTDGKPVEDVSVKIPLPAHTASASFSASSGTVVYDDATKECTWMIGRLSKDGISPSLNGTITLLPGRAGRDVGVSLFANFKVVTFATSGLKVASLRLEREEYQPYKGVRSITYAGRVEVRT